MASFFKLPFLLPFKFVPNASNGIHFDDRWACEQIQNYEMRSTYKQKWVRSDTTKLQCESSIQPKDLAVYRMRDRQVVKTLPWQPVFDGTFYKVYELLWDVSDLPEDVYVPYQLVDFLAIKWEAIGEPIDVRDSWPHTLLFKYRNSYNDHDVAFTTGVEFAFRCEATIPAVDMNPERERAAMVSQTQDVKTLSGTPWRTFKLYIGGNPGALSLAVAPYIVDVLNRIFVCDTVRIEGKRYESAPDSKWEVQRIKGFPLVTAELSITPAFNNESLEFIQEGEIAPGIVTAYNIETTFFGPGTLIPITDIEQQ